MNVSVWKVFEASHVLRDMNPQDFTVVIFDGHSFNLSSYLNKDQAMSFMLNYKVFGGYQIRMYHQGKEVSVSVQDLAGDPV